MGEEESEASIRTCLEAHEKHNQELLSKYKPGQWVKLFISEDKTKAVKIIKIYSDFNGGSVEDVFFDYEDSEGNVVTGAMADKIVNIIEDPDASPIFPAPENLEVDFGPDWPGDRDDPF
jgi:Mor family transcriptional regulator